MSKITLISFYPGFFGLNLRCIGSSLRAAGFKVNYLHLGYTNFTLNEHLPSLVNFIDMDQLVDQILPEIEGSLYAGISLTASEFAAARNFTQALKKKTKIPVVWGGPHPTSSYENSAMYADFVCVGEGEQTAVELAKRFNNNEKVHDVQNLAYRIGEKIHLNQLYPLIENIDSLPLPDTDIYSHKIFIEGKIHHLTPGLLIAIDKTYKRPVPDKVIYLTTITRGCPFSCSFCNNSYLRRIYDGERYFRYRSLDHLFMEVRQACNDVKEIGAVFLADDNLTTLPEEILHEFGKRWKREIGLPFGTSGSPVTLKENKFRILAETGLLYKFGVGIESASQRILNIYNRKETPKKAAEAVALVEKYRPYFYQKNTQPNINFQFIFDNPYEKIKDITATLRFIIKNIPVIDTVTSFHLIMYPGSEIYRKAIEDRLSDYDTEIYMESYGDLDPTFTKVWLTLFYKGTPRWILYLLSSRVLFTFFNSFIFRKLYQKIVPKKIS